MLRTLHARALHRLERGGLRTALQLPTPAFIKVFGDDRSGQTKPAFLLWMLRMPYEYAWHIEDDAFFAGPWRALRGPLSWLELP